MSAHITSRQPRSTAALTAQRVGAEPDDRHGLAVVERVARNLERHDANLERACARRTTRCCREETSRGRRLWVHVTWTRTSVRA